MPEFGSPVNAPSPASYNAPLLNFSQFANWANQFQQGQRSAQQQQLGDQQQQLNAQEIQKQQQQLDLAQAFPNGLPIDPKTGQLDYAKAASVLAAKGGINTAIDLLQAQPPALSPMFGGMQPASPQGGAAPQGPAPASVPARPLPPTAANSPQGDSGNNTITSLVTARLPEQNQTTGQTIMKVAQVLGLDPNADLTPGQVRRAQGLINRYAPEIAGPAANGGGGTLPPSANAVSPKPPAAPAPVSPPAAPQATPAPQAPSQPIVPQVPLPKGFNDPQAAILALRAEAARLSSNPRAGGQVAELNNWASRIEDSLKPISVGPSTTLVDPRTGKPLVQGASLYGANASGPTLDADAERYRQTGTLPPNMGRGIQGEMQSRQIRARAAELEIQAGGDPAQWPTKWQDYKASGVGKNASERVRANREENLNLILKAADAAIPAALEASKNLPRSQYVPLNRLIQKGEIMSSDPRLVEFGMANLQLAEHWARAMNPTGVMRESDRDKALSFLDTAYANNTYERAVRQLEKQITRERDAVKGGSTILKDGKAPDPGADPSKKSGADGWTTVKVDGKDVRIREKADN